MRAKYFILGVLAGLVGGALVLAVVVLALSTRPVSLPTQPGSPSTGDVTISITEAYLSRMSSEMAREQEMMVQDVAVDVRPGGLLNMTVGVQLSILGQTLHLQAQLVNTVRVEDGRLRFDLQSIGFAGMELPLDFLPQSMRTSLDTMVGDINDRVSRILTQSGLVPLSVTTDDASITVALRGQ